MILTSLAFPVPAMLISPAGVSVGFPNKQAHGKTHRKWQDEYQVNQKVQYFFAFHNNGAPVPATKEIPTTRASALKGKRKTVQGA